MIYSKHHTCLKKISLNSQHIEHKILQIHLHVVCYIAVIESMYINKMHIRKYF